MDFLGVHDVLSLAMKAYYTLAFKGMSENDAEPGTSTRGEPAETGARRACGAPCGPIHRRYDGMVMERMGKR
jgi:hypothetical protein